MGLIGTTNLNAQKIGLEVGVFADIPDYNLDDSSPLNIGGGVAYYYEAVKNLNIGGIISYDHITGIRHSGTRPSSRSSISFVPIGASVKYSFVYGIFGGADLGYALSITDQIDGGVYYRP